MSTVYHYQEIVCLRTDRPHACELLLRQHQQYNLKAMLSDPSLFKTHLNALVKAKINASKQLFQQDQFSAIFLNFTPDQITDPNFREAITQLSKAVTPTRRICIEITEDIKTSEWSLMYDNLVMAKSLGLMVGIDDFGVGYSNFASILSLTPDIVKLDNQYVNQALKGSAEKRAFFRLVEFIQDLESKVVVEGIECEQGKRLAKQSSAELGQGFALHRPSPILSTSQ